MTLRELIRRYSDDTGTPYEVAKIVILGTYKHLRDKQEEMKELHLNVTGLGQWNMKTWKLDKLKDKVQKTFDHFPTSGKLELLKRVEGAIELRKKEKGRKSAHWDHRKWWEKQDEEMKLIEKQQKENRNEQQATTTKGESAEGMGEQNSNS